ncbi:LIM domain transcription factor LMO4.2 [Eumeta japonica]|uniref:LIM domain transcription factor LMO4.2 n=1 Tax=Eumeta variegata TaxID=151549 RepID=A0A4C1YE16_EUMVA|nr:LIM domain transcription factor LMO4.2 [Eumeta japonica]
MFGSSGACAACGQAIPASEFVMRTGAPPLHVFHIKCFACSKCGAHLMQGDRYYMLAGSLVCEQDWHKLVKSASATPGPGAPVRKGKRVTRSAGGCGRGGVRAPRDTGPARGAGELRELERRRSSYPP